MIDLPDEYPEETVYSLAARYSERFNFPNKVTVYDRLFGKCHPISSTFPKNLDFLANSLPKNNDLTTQKLLSDHSLLPYYSPFLNEQKLKQTISYLTKSSGNKMATRGIKSYIPWLRYCPICVIEDRSKYGETYWKRLPQIEAIKVCPIHEVLLKNSSVSCLKQTENTPNFGNLYPAEKVIYDISHQRIDRFEESQRLSLQFAKDVEWLLSSHSFKGYHKNIFIGYRREFRKAKLKKATIKNSRDLANSFIQFFPKEFLNNLGFNNMVDGNGWIKEMFSKANSFKPERHISLMYFFGYDLKSFLESVLDQNLFTPPPWPCLNPYCERHLESAIQEFHTPVQYKKGTIVATFSCECGLIYQRKGPDISPNDSWRADSIIKLGDVFKDGFQNAPQNQNLSPSDIETKLKKSTTFTLLHDPKTKLWPEFNKFNIQPVSLRELILEFSPYISQDLTQIYRNAWLGLCHAYPNAPAITLRKKGGAIYIWLKKHDPLWLKSHFPCTPFIKPSLFFLNTDEEIANYIIQATQNELNSPKYPRRISYEMLSIEIELLTNRKMPQKGYFLKHLPYSKEIFENVQESTINYTVRKVEWMSHKLRSKKLIYRHWDLRRLTNVLGTRLREDPTVQNAIELAMRKLYPLE